MKPFDEMTPDEERELWKDALRRFKQYTEAGRPFGPSPDALKIWFDYGRIGRKN